MKDYWNTGIAIGEFVGSLILTLGIILTTTVANKKSFGLDTSLKRRGFVAAVF